MDIEAMGVVWPEWEVVQQIGEGTYGKVYKVVREEYGLTSYAAVKAISIPQNDAEINVLFSEGLEEASVRSYFASIVNDFVNEIKFMVSMKGAANIVSVDDYKVVEKTGKIGWGIFIRMELLTSLVDYTAKRKMTETEVTKLGQDVCAALALCSRRKIIHRDIKPENIFVSPFGDFKVGDFGIARELEKTSSAMSAKGTYNYMAPEIMSSQYDATVDFYSLGLVLYKLLNNNRLPFIDAHAQRILYCDRQNAIERRFNGEPLPAPVEASPQMAQLILQACAFDPVTRFQTAAAFKNALEVVKGGLPEADEQTKEQTEALVLAEPAAVMLVEEVVPDIDSTIAGRRPQGVQGVQGARGVNADFPAYPNQGYNGSIGTLGKSKQAFSRETVIVMAVIVALIALAGVGVIFLLNVMQNAKDANNDFGRGLDFGDEFKGEDQNFSDKTDVYVPNTVGNTSGNIVCGGRVAAQGDQVYYFNQDDSKYGLWTMGSNGDNKKRLIDESAFYINVVGDWIYYFGVDSINSIKTDGSHIYKVVDAYVSNLIVVDDWIYFSVSSDGIYSLRPDGTGMVKLYEYSLFDYGEREINIDNGRIYFDAMSGVHSMKTDGSDLIKLSDDPVSCLTVSDGRIYYLNLDDAQKIYSMKIDGSDRKKVCDELPYQINVADGKIYYINRYGGNICVINVDGSGWKELNNEDSFSVNIIGDRIYYYKSEDLSLHSMKTDGSDKIKES
ncbi:MAG: DUF5050 domain-containing protein [Peptococcaceae bacterium]|nr:DUF5050 domain-containing protein [Peptococcaceae bacterium]